ncbi:MAG: FAD-dependent oxidoreductase [Cytophagales bacterium]|nr:FAD-dependent oxidoreductase [Cytophagales bacterium]
MENSKIAVVGGGISGMAAAFYLQKLTGQSVDVFEKQQRIGGCVDTMTLEDYWLELGAHTCYNSYTELISLVEGLEMGKEVLARQKAAFRVLKNGRLKTIQSQLSFFSLFLNLPKSFLASKKGKTVREFYSGIIGRKNYEQLMKYMFRAVICQEADDFPADFFLKRRAKKRKDYPASFTFQGGLSSLVKRIAELKTVNVKRELVFALEKQDKGFQLVTESGDAYEDDYVVLAVPPQAASQILSRSFANLSGELASYAQSRSKSFGVIVEKASVLWKPTAVAVSTEGKFMSVVSRDTVNDENFRGFTFHAKDDSVTLQEAKQFIQKTRSVPESAILKIEEKLQVLPKLSWKQEELVRSIQLELEDLDLGIVGNYFHGLSLEDCVQRAREESERLAKRWQTNG